MGLEICAVANGAGPCRAEIGLGVEAFKFAQQSEVRFGEWQGNSSSVRVCWRNIDGLEMVLSVEKRGIGKEETLCEMTLLLISCGFTYLCEPNYK